MKTKIGTMIDTRLLTSLKIRAAEEHRPLNALIEDALHGYLSDTTDARGRRLAALRRACDNTIDLPRSDLDTLLTEDSYFVSAHLSD